MSDELKKLIYKFDCNGHNAPAYSCNKPGDNSGCYVHLRDYQDLQTQLTAAREEIERLKKRFPMQRGPDIDYLTAEKVYKLYSELFGNNQTLERLGERGGFSWREVESMQELYIKKFGHNAYGEIIK